MGDPVRVSVKVLTDEGKQTENNCDKCKTNNRKGVDCVQNVQHSDSHKQNSCVVENPVDNSRTKLLRTQFTTLTRKAVEIPDHNTHFA